MAKKNREFWESAKRNNLGFRKYYNRLSELALSRFTWNNIPDTIDTRFLELTLMSYGMAVFFYDDAIGYLALPCRIGGQLDVYRIPKKRTAYASNGFNADLDETNSVIIFNNMLHTPCTPEIEDFAQQLWDIEQTVIVNAKAQKTPVLLSCSEQERLTVKNAYMQYEGNMPVIHAYKDFDPNSIRAISTGAPYVAGNLYQLKTNIWNEALTFLGIANLTPKKERVITDEATMNMGGVVASRFSPLNSRENACDAINRMFGLNISVSFQGAFSSLDTADTEDAEFVDEGGDSDE